MESRSQSPGKTQWIFPSIEFSCQTTITSIVYAAVTSSGTRHPKFQIWRPTESKTFLRVDRVEDNPMRYNETETVYSYSGLVMEVMPGDILGVHQPSEGMSMTTFILRDNRIASSYSLRTKQLSSFDVDHEEVELRHAVPLVSITASGT